MEKLACKAVLTVLLAVLASCGGGSEGGSNGLSAGPSSSSLSLSKESSAGFRAIAAKDESSDGLTAPAADSLGGVASLRAQGADVLSMVTQRSAGRSLGPYATLDTSSLGMPRTLVYDAKYGDLYASYPSTYESVGLSAIVRFRSNGTTWKSSTLSIPGLRDIALASDRSVLAATDTSDHVHLIDLATFSIKSSHVSEAGITDTGSNTEVGIAFTNDGKLWMPTGHGYGWNGVGFFDLRTLTFGNASPPCGSCYYGPYFAVARGGSRLMVTQSASMSPAPPMLYMDTVNGTFKPNPIGLEFFYSQTSLSDSGDRFLMNGYMVYDRAFGSVGRVTQPSSGVRASQLSPDGRRAYILSYAVEPGSSALPVVQVFDTSIEAGTQVNLPLVGTFTIADLPGCQTSTYPMYSCYQPRMRVSADGNNLMILGDKKLIIAPIPKALSGSI